jgi:bifunctional DNA-binding transcriptional regulator/antitoxin component of YhaV-PrlF toxin-antitoxin module
MARLKVTARGQVTFRKDLLRHLGLQPGQQLDAELLPDGVVRLKAASGAGSLDAFIGRLAGRSRKVASLDEMRRATTEGWAGRR